MQAGVELAIIASGLVATMRRSNHEDDENDDFLKHYEEDEDDDAKVYYVLHVSFFHSHSRAQPTTFQVH